jgi:hypothetical protein
MAEWISQRFLPRPSQKGRASQQRKEKNRPAAILRGIHPSHSNN